MATIKLEIVAGQTFTLTKTIANADLTRFLKAYRTLLGQVQSGVDVDVKPIMRDMTDLETFNAWANSILAGTLANVISTEKSAAAKTSSDAVTPIPLT